MNKKKSVAIMQPYFLPYIGYFQLINAVDEFVVYDNIQYTKKGWINRNRYLLNGSDSTFSIPLKKDRDWKDIIDRSIAEDFDNKKLFRKIESAYKKAPNFASIIPIIEEIIFYEDKNLFRYIVFSLKKICNVLDIKTDIITSSLIDIDHSLESQNRVIQICNSLKATNYINLSGGVDLYDYESFKDKGIALQFISSNQISYKQFNNEFVPFLSILDLLMFNNKETLNNFIHKVNLT